MRTEPDVREFFDDYLPREASPAGSFCLLEHVLLKMDVDRREARVFRISPSCLSCHAASGVAPNTEPDNGEYPSFFLVDAQRIYRARGTLQDSKMPCGERGFFKRI